jgi:hypothetical protein
VLAFDRLVDDLLDHLRDAELSRAVIRAVTAVEPRWRAHEIEQIADDAELGGSVAAHRADPVPEPRELIRFTDRVAVQAIGQVNVADEDEQRAFDLTIVAHAVRAVAAP